MTTSDYRWLHVTTGDWQSEIEWLWDKLRMTDAAHDYEELGVTSSEYKWLQVGVRALWETKILRWITLKQTFPEIFIFDTNVCLLILSLFCVLSRMPWRAKVFLCSVATWIFVPIPLTHTLGWKLKNPSTIYNCHITKKIDKHLMLTRN